MQAAARILVEHIHVLLQVCDQRRAVGAALVGLPQAVQFQPHVLQPQFRPQRMRQQNDLGIGFRAGKAQRLGTDLVELAVAAALWPFMPEHRPHVVQALAAVVEHGMLYHRTHHPRRCLGAQRQLFTVEPVLEGVHLLLDDVGDFAQAAHEQRRRLDDGRADVAISVARHEGAHLVLQPFPARRIGRKNVVHALDGNQLLHLVLLFVILNQISL